MKNRRWVTNVFAGAVALLLAGSSYADVVNVTGVMVGADGSPSGGTLGGDNVFHGNDGTSGYIAPQNGTDSYVFTNAILTGGTGGAVIGTDPTATYQAGYGGNGLLSQGGSSVTPLVTINSGTYTGGSGGIATGTAFTQLIGGGGGGGLDVNNSTAIVNGGTFIGGNGGTTDDPNSFAYSAGPGLNANLAGIIIINDGTFQGGVTTQPGSGDGDAILGLGGTVSIFGGTFTGGGTGGFGLDNLAGTITLFGTNFAVNGVPTTGDLTGSGTITGTLQDDGTPFSMTFTNPGGTIDLVTVPEPASLGALSFGAACVLMRTRRRQNRIA
jgi:hypothetical protein